MLWAIRTYFNPERDQRRLANYMKFRARLETPLITVELGFDGRTALQSLMVEPISKLSACALCPESAMSPGRTRG